MKKLIATLLLGVMTIGMIGCGGASPEKTVEKYFNDIKKVEISTDGLTKEEKESFDYVKENFAEELKGVQKKATEMMKDVDVEILSTEEKDDKATVKVKIQAVDASEFFVKFVGELFSTALKEALTSAISGEEEMSDSKIYGMAFEILNKSLEDVEFKTVEREYTIELEMVDGEWIISDEEALALEIMNIDSSQFKQFEDQLNNL